MTNSNQGGGSDERTRLRPSPSPDDERTKIRGESLAADAEPKPRVQEAPNSKTMHRAQARAAPEAQMNLVPGAVIKERFVIESLLGRGGMGIVFAAIDRRKQEARDPNPQIAIKILNADFRNHPDALVALQREARKAQTLAHPNVVTVFDFDREGSNIYMTMERLRGRSLDDVVREARGSGIGRAAALPIVRGVAEGLAYAHRKGIIHSDLKPGNLFVTEDGTPKILDFGISRAVPNAAAVEQDSFDAGSLGAYTEAYSTAEMIDGVDPHPSDDVYALGLIAYELFTGKHPYERRGAIKARAAGISPTAPKELTRREWRVLQRALAFDRQTRPADAGEFLRLFFGVTRLQKSLLAAVCVLALVSGFFWYRSYQAGGPAVPFAQLPTETQEQFKSLMTDGDKGWQFYLKDHNLVILYDAVDQYADAYKLHPRNRDATRALERAADAFLEATKGQPEQQRAAAEALAAKSEYLAKYAPLESIKAPATN